VEPPLVSTPLGDPHPPIDEGGAPIAGLAISIIALILSLGVSIGLIIGLILRRLRG